MKLKLDCSKPAYERLHEAASKPRGKLCEVTKEDLAALLRDHNKLYNVLKGEIENAD